MPFTTDEVALQLKNQHPELQKLDNKTLIAEIVKRRPDVAGEILDYEAPGAIEPNAGLPIGGFEGGMMNSITKPLAGGAGLVAGAIKETPTSTFLTKYANSPEADDESAMGKDLGNAAQYYMAPNALAKLRAIPALANAPWLRALLGAVVEGGKANVVSGWQGAGTGERTLQSIIGGAGGAMSQIGKPLAEGAAKSFTRAVGADAPMVEKVTEIAPDAIRSGVRGTRKQMGAMVAERLPGAEAEQVAASSSKAPLDLSPASDALRTSAEMAGPGLHPTLNQEEITMLREVVDSPMFKNLKPTAQKNVLESFAKQLNLGKGADVLQVLKESESAHKVLEGGVFVKSDMLSDAAQGIDDFQAAHGGTAPLDRTVRYRQGLGDLGQPGQKAMPSTDPTLSREVARTAAERLNDVLHDMGNPATKRLADADKNFSQLKTLDSTLRDALSKDVSQIMREHFTKYVIGRLVVGGVVGGTVGGIRGGSGRSTLEGVAGGAALAGMMNTALWNSVSASAKLRIADAINAGQFDRAASIFEAATATSRKRGGLPAAPED